MKPAIAHQRKLIPDRGTFSSATEGYPPQ